MGACAAVILDWDGVIADTSHLHSLAWKMLVDKILKEIPGIADRGFDIDQDYGRFFDGRSSERGLRDFLTSRAVDLSEGIPGDAADTLSIHGLASLKRQIFETLQAHEEIRVFPDALALLRRLAEAKIPTALVATRSVSREAMVSAGVLDQFTVVVPCLGGANLSLPDSAFPDMFLDAARRLGVGPARTGVVVHGEDRVEAGVAGGFALVAEVDRSTWSNTRRVSGADVIVADLRALDLGVGKMQDIVSESTLRALEEVEHPVGALDPWLLTYEGFDPVLEGRREALCTLGNGYWATRASFPGSVADETHYPGSYLAGVFNRVTTDLAGRRDESEHMVNTPDWTFLSVRAVGGPVLRPGQAEMLCHRQELDLRRGILTRMNRYRDSDGRTTSVISRQFQSLAHRHLACLETTVEAENWSGEIMVVSAVNGGVENRNAAVDRQLTAHHLAVVAGTTLDDEVVLLESRTSQSEIGIATALRTRLTDEDGNKAAHTSRFFADGNLVGRELVFSVEAGRPVVIEKLAAVATSRDRAISTAALSAIHKIRSAPDAGSLAASQSRIWEGLWDRFGIIMRGGIQQSQDLNLNIFHVLQTVFAAEPDLDAGVPARGLHGEGYRGHIFWDELFIYPMLTLRRPDLTRSLLLYRFRRLDEARAAARRVGLTGAMFPWQSGSDGREETPAALFNVRDQQWMPDHSHRQRHVGLAVAYSVWQYYQASGDLDFIEKYGAEILIEISRFFAALAAYDAVDDRFDITGVMGPDEFHDGYPGRPGEGLRNNAYTNVMVSWVLTKTAEAIGQLNVERREEICTRLSLDAGELERWGKISRRLRVPFHADGIISQFEGYEELKEFDWAVYRTRYGDIGRLDLILQAEADSTNCYKLSKQADVLMLFYLLSAEELKDVFDRLGYPLPQDLLPRTIQYYLSRTSHGSTLSRLAHSWVLARSDREQSWSLFAQALECDIADTQGGTTHEGIHLGAMAGTSDMVLRCYGGVETRNGTLWLHPLLPLELPHISFRLYFRDQGMDVEVTTDGIGLQLFAGNANPIEVCIEGAKRTLGPGDKLQMSLATGECVVTRAV
ncbi:HAD family hydrolase [Paeniglutamicibacter kerguelensis]